MYPEITNEPCTWSGAVANTDDGRQRNVSVDAEVARTPNEEAVVYLNHKIRRLERRVIELENRTAKPYMPNVIGKAAPPAPMPEKSYRDILFEAQARREPQRVVEADPQGDGK